MRAMRAAPAFDKTASFTVASSHFILTVSSLQVWIIADCQVPPSPNKIVKSDTTLTNLPYDILQDIVTMAATSAVTGRRREWKAKQRERVRDGTPVQEACPRQVLVDPAPTNNLVSLMKVSRALYWIAGAEMYSHLSKIDVAEGALGVMYKSKTDLLTHENRTLRIHFHHESECLGRQPSPSSFEQTPVPIRQLHIPVETRDRGICQLFDCPSTLHFLPRTLVLWMTEYCTFNTGLADRYHPHQIKNLVVRLGMPSDWCDWRDSICNQALWFRPFIKTTSVVFIIENRYMWNMSQDDRDLHMGPNPKDDIYLRRDMRYNPEDNLHPWLSRFTSSLIDYCLDPDYAKDVTIVNIGSVKSETLGLAEDYLDLKADFKCERCYTESQFEKMFCAEYDRIYSEQKTGAQQVPKAKFKFIPFREYIQKYESENTLSKDDERYYAEGVVETTGVDGKVYRVCPKCFHQEEEIETK